ncbi:MAG: DUF5058 family protein [Lachnospiraceae bacterium]|nr:DUF5058 family protein [Lachnospiraceae bacterium]
MGNYTSMVNDPSLTFFVAVILILVTAVCVLFMKKGWTEAKRLGVTDSELKKIVANCIGISLVPSIPIVLSVIVMVPVLGVGLPWLRTSVIGSANNELIAATMAAEATGVEFTTTSMTAEAWINAAWAMTLGCSIALPIVLVVLKPVCQTYDVFRKKDSRWISIFSLCALVTVIAAFAVNSGKKGGVPAIVIIACFIFSYLCNIIAKNEKLKWFKDYAFPLTILFGLILSMIITPVLS